MKEKLKKIASYFWDIPIQITSSEQNQYLEVVWSQGKKMLNTRDANFSFGNGYAVFERALSQIENRLPSIKDALILGFGCGSILHLFEKKYDYTGSITGVEYDPEILTLFKNHFSSAYYSSTDLICMDAELYVKHCTKQFDIIFIDLFIELDNASFIFSPKFNDHLVRLIRQNGTLVFNTTVKNNQDKSNCNELLLYLSKHFKNVVSFEFQSLNSIIIAH